MLPASRFWSFAGGRKPVSFLSMIEISLPCVHDSSSLNIKFFTFDKN